MLITRITYSRLLNLGDYENERIELSAELTSLDDYEKCFAVLKTNTFKLTKEYRKAMSLIGRCREILEAPSEHSTWEVQRAIDRVQGYKAMFSLEGLEYDIPDELLNKPTID